MSAAWGRVRGLAKYLGAQQSSVGKMITLLSIIALGFFLGMRHATDPDHVIAVTTIVSRQRSIRHAALIGILWGLGHTITIFLVGSAIILFGVVIPPKLGLTMELSVGLMLILLGVLNLTGFTRWITETFTPQSPDGQGHPHVHSHAHTHQQGDFVHAHPHRHEPEKHGHAEDATPVGWMDRIFDQLGLYQAVRPLAVGLVHGLAGSAAVALLVLTTIRDPRWAIAYLLVFGRGHHCRHDADHRRHRFAVQIFAIAFRAFKSWFGRGLRNPQYRLRHFHRLSNGLRQRHFYQPSTLGPGVGKSRLRFTVSNSSCKFPRQSVKHPMSPEFRT
jgi:ABC-type nickel/cobalt efflux system permease component RcnA